jgi:tryptophan-rich sensory protein
MLNKARIAFGGLAVAVVALTSILGQLATRPNLAPWYAGLIKPAFNPPNWVFAPVWTALFVLMAFAMWRILCLPRDTPGRGRALMLFLVQLAMNAAWSWMFFGAQSPLLGMVNIVPQILMIFATVKAFWRLDKLAALCLAPLAAWVSFACGLNFEILRLNSGTG